MKINNTKIVNRWNGIMNDIGLEYLTIGTKCSELEYQKKYYTIEDGITIGWMLKEARYWLSCYYESGNCRCDDRFESKHCYKIWVSETGRLKRLIAALEKMKNELVVEWTEEATEQMETIIEEPKTEYEWITKEEAKEIYCNGEQIYTSEDGVNFSRVPSSGEYGSHASTEELFYRSIRGSKNFYKKR